jgi:beta-glucanase (GH16 family)
MLALALVGSPAARAAGDEPSRHRVKSQGVSIHILPAIRQPGIGAASSEQAVSVIVATVRPAQAGRRVVLERLTAQGWRPQRTLKTNAAGRAEFFPTIRQGEASYRVVAQSYRGLSQRQSTTVASDTWGDAYFDDEFSGAALGPAWEHRIQFYNPWGGRACSKGSPAAVSVVDGALQLRSLPDPATTETCTVTDEAGSVTGQYPYRLNGHISTQHQVDFLYGVAAARMKFQRNPGAHAAFWLQPRGLLETGPTPWGAEVDVVEWYGNKSGRSRLSSTVHAPLASGAKVSFGGPVSKPDRFLLTRSDSWWLRYHVFSVEWTPNEYIFRISGHEVWRTDQGISHDPEFLILSMLSSDFELPEAANVQGLTQTAGVDWVKVWQADPSA